MFLICQIGDSEDATTFLRELENDKNVGEMVYCSADRLDELSRKVEKRGGGRTYTARVRSWLTQLADT